MTYHWEIILSDSEDLSRGPFIDNCDQEIVFLGPIYADYAYVNLTVTNNLGFSTKYGKVVDFQNPPIATISPETETLLEIGNQIFLNGSAIDNDKDGSIVSYTWESSLDGVLSLEQSTNVMLSLGTHQISFSATDNEGIKGLPDTITVVVYQPIVVFMSSDLEVDIGESVLFSPTINDPGNVSKYEWDFNGDGVYDWSSTTTGETAFKYNEKGVYEAKLQVTDKYGATTNSTRRIAVATELPTPASSSSADDTDNTLLIAAGIVGVAIIGAAVVMSRRKTDDPYAQQFPEPAAKPEPVEKKTFTPKKKKVTKTFKPKAELATIECPGCQAKMKVPKLGELQEVTCKECGLSGEIEI